MANETSRLGGLMDFATSETSGIVSDGQNVNRMDDENSTSVFIGENVGILFFLFVNIFSVLFL